MTRERKAAEARQRYQARKNAGLCVRCAAPATCGVHCDKHAERLRQAAARARQLEPAPEPTGVRPPRGRRKLARQLGWRPERAGVWRKGEHVARSEWQGGWYLCTGGARVAGPWPTIDALARANS